MQSYDFDPRAFGAKGVDQHDVGTTGSITIGTTALTVASAAKFSVGDYIAITGAGVAGVKLGAQITAISGTSITISVLAQTTVSGQLVEIDDAPAFAAAFTAAIDFGNGTTTVAYRMGRLAIPSCPPGWAWNFATPAFSFNLSQGGAGTGSALHYDIVGVGADGPIRCAVGTGIDVMSIIVSGLEWAMGRIFGIAFVSSSFATAGTGIDCRSALAVDTTVGKCIVDEIHCIGVQADADFSAGIIHLQGGDIVVGTVHNAGCLASDGAHGIFLHYDGVGTCSLGSVFDFSEYCYLGWDNGSVSALGAIDRLIHCTPSQDTSWGATKLRINNLHSTSRSQYALTSAIKTGTVRAEVIHVDNCDVSSGGISCFVMVDINHFVVENGIYRAGSSVFAFDMYNFKTCSISRLGTPSGGTTPKFRGDGSGSFRILDTPFSSITPGTGGTVLVDQSTVRSKAVGASLASASTIALVTDAHPVTGTSTISTITPPYTQFTGIVTLMAVGAFAWTTGGNIGAAGVATAGNAYSFFYDGTTMWPIP